VVREGDKDCPLSWEDDEGLQQLVEQKRNAPDAWTWFVDNCLKQVNVTAYNNFVKTGIMNVQRHSPSPTRVWPLLC
jgi:hypothetical protein